MPNEIEAFPRREERQRDRDELDDLVEATRSRGAQKRFQLRKREFNRVEIRTVGWKKSEARPDALNCRLHLRLLMHGKVVEHDDVTGAERRHQHLLDIREKRGIVDRPVEHRRRVQAIDAQRSDDGVRLPVAIGRVVAEPQPAETAPVAAQQVGRDPGLIDEDVAARVVQS